MNSVRIHALEGSMLSHPQGVKKLISLFKEGKEKTEVFVLSPVSSSDYQLLTLLTDAAEHEEKLWSRLEKSQSIWNELAESSLETPDSVQERMSESFSDIEEVLRAVWIMQDVPEAASSYIGTLTSSFLSWILSAAFNENGIHGEILSPDLSRKNSAELVIVRAAFFSCSVLIFMIRSSDIFQWQPWPYPRPRRWPSP